MTLVKRALTLSFQRAVTAGQPDEMEVAIAPLSEPNSSTDNAILVGGTQTQTILLANENNPVVFNLVATDNPGLTSRVTYRVAWRVKYLGRQYTADFVMPDFDVNYVDLGDLGQIIGGETYLQWSDRSKPDGVAGLNSAGQVIDAEGNAVTGSESAAIVQGKLDTEIVARQQGDNLQRIYFVQYTQDQITSVYSSTSMSLTQAVSILEAADVIERAQRVAAINTVNANVTNARIGTSNQIDQLNSLIDQYNAQLSSKADLVGGKIPSGQIPDISLVKSVSVANQSSMLALTNDQVQPGDLCKRPDGVWFLNALPIVDLSNWVKLTVDASVFSVNGAQGVVVLAAADVGARALSTPVPQTDVAGLTSALAGKASTGTTSSLSTRISNIETDASYVKKSGGLILRADMPVDAVFTNVSNLITKKDGTVLNVGAGGAIEVTDVQGLTTALNAKLDSTDASVTNSRTPTAHKTSHAIGGSDVLTPADIGARASATAIVFSDVTGLQTALDSKGAVTTVASNVTRLDSAETRIENLELGGGGGGTNASGKTVWWSAVAAITPLDTSTDAILLRSPFGFNGTDHYYDPAGASSSESVWPYVTPNGHLKFVKRNEANAADPALATQADLTTLTTTVGGKAAQTSLDATNTQVGLRATLTQLATVQSQLDLAATISSVSTLADVVALKAATSTVDALTTTVGTKADSSTVSTLSTLVGTKANTTDLTALTARVAATETGKADLSAGKLTSSQVPDIATSKVTGLDAALALKADLVSGQVSISQVPDIATSKVTGLDSSLALKADLVSGKIPTSQIPATALNTVVSVTSRSAMLALTTSQVQAGDVCVITATSDKGSYILGPTGDPTSFANWVKLQVPDDVVQSVNGYSGTVVLAASDVGARSSGTPIALSEVTTLVSSLAAKVDTTTYTTGLAGKTAPTDVQTMLNDSVSFKSRADLVATASVATLSGQQSVDGVLTPIGSVVLLTAQPSSVSNGLYTVAAGSWTRVTDMTVGSFFVRGSAVVVISGASNLNTIWQQTAVSGVVGTNINNWTKVLTAGAPPVYTASTGVQRIANEFSAKVVSGGGIQAVSGGLQLDPAVATRKVIGTVPSPGTQVVSITHNLNTYDLSNVLIYEVSTMTVVQAGIQLTGLNNIGVEFKNAPVSGEYKFVITG